MSTAAATDLSVSTAAATASPTKCHLFKIEGYKRVKILYGNGRCLESCGFEAGGRTWRIQFYPNGNRKETAGHVSLFLKLEDGNPAAAADDDKEEEEEAHLLAEVRLALVPHRRRPAGPLRGLNFTTTFRFDKEKKVVGYSQFVRRDDLEKSEFLQDDCLAVSCDVAVLKQRVDAEERAAQTRDMDRLHMVCECSDGACKGRHLRGGAWLREMFANFFLGCFQV